MSTTSPSQLGVEGTAWEVVWMITEESARLVMSTSLLGKFCILPSKEAHFMPARYKLDLVAQFVGNSMPVNQEYHGFSLKDVAYAREHELSLRGKNAQWTRPFSLSDQPGVPGRINNIIASYSG